MNDIKKMATEPKKQPKKEVIDVILTVTPTHGLHIREQANAESKSLGVLRKCSTVRWSGEKKMINGVEWKKVEVLTGIIKGTKGFCSGTFLK